MNATRRTAHLVAQMHISTPLGTMLAARSASGLAGLWFTDQADCPDGITAPLVSADPILDDCAAHLEAYWLGHQPVWRGPTDLHGTAFQRSIWQALLRIPPGQSVSYGDLAKQVDRANAHRAVGVAVGANPISVLIPCHRVIGAQGALTGFSGGMHRKIALLQHEGFQIQQGRVKAAQTTLFPERFA